MMTPLDQAHAAMMAAPDDDAARLAWFGRLADCELFLLLEAEAQGDDIAPALFSVEEGRFAVAFDTPERMVGFAQDAVPYAALSGRLLAAMLAGHDIGLAINPGAEPGEMLIPAVGLDWLTATLTHAPQARSGQPRSFAPPDGVPDGVPEGLFTALDGKLAGAGGLAQAAWLVAAEWDDGASSLALAFVGTAPGAEPALARAMAEALAFSGLGQGSLDVIFLPPGSVAAGAAARVGLGFVLPLAQHDSATPPAPPGMDPARPPRLR